ncbi:MAG: hypothetical protein M9929_05840 [Burkholderiaceae bacterium]|nr:hypothetical protein [Burkholderiaceae bacterium]
MASVWARLAARLGSAALPAAGGGVASDAHLGAHVSEGPAPRGAPGASDKFEPWDVAPLSVAAASWVLEGAAAPDGDPLARLATVSGNLPALARFLARQPVPRALQDLAAALAPAGLPDATAAINGIALNPMAPTFNVFSLLNVLRAEAGVLAQLDSLPLSPRDRRRVLALGIAGSPEAVAAASTAAASGGSTGGTAAVAEAQRVDVWVEESDWLAARDDDEEGGGGGDSNGEDGGEDGGEGEADVHRHPIVHWLNDVEGSAAARDMHMRRWPASLSALMYPTHEHQPHLVRRNLYNIFLLMDASTSTVLRALLTVQHYTNQRVPLRFGALLLPGRSEEEAGDLRAAADARTPRTAADDLQALASGLDMALLHAAALVRHGSAGGHAFLTALVAEWRAAAEVAQTAALQAVREAADAAGTSMDNAAASAAALAAVDGVRLTRVDAVGAFDAARTATVSVWQRGRSGVAGVAVLADASGKWRRLVVRVAGWAAQRGLLEQAPAVVLNGIVMPGLALDGPLFTAMAGDREVLVRAVVARTLDDGVAPSVYAALLGHATRLNSQQGEGGARVLLPGSGATVARYTRGIFTAPEMHTFLPLAAPVHGRLLATTRYLHAAGTADDVKPVSLTLLHDLGTLAAWESMRTLLAAVADGAGPVAAAARVAFVHVAAASDAADGLGELIAGAAALVAGVVPGVVAVRVDEQVAVLAALVEVARDVGEGATPATLVTAWAAALEAAAPPVPLKPRAAARLATALRDLAGGKAPWVAALQQRIREAASGGSALLVAALGSAPHGALAANGRVVPLAAPRTASGTSGTAAGAAAAAVIVALASGGAASGADEGGAASLTSPLLRSDVEALVYHERGARGAAVASLLSGIDFHASSAAAAAAAAAAGGADGGDAGKGDNEEGALVPPVSPLETPTDADALTADWISGVVMAAASAVGSALSVASGSLGGRATGRAALASRLLEVTAGASFCSVSGTAPAHARGREACAALLEGEASGSKSTGLMVTAVLDPTSEAAARLAPLLLMARDYLGATVTVHLTPKERLTELPFKSFYRFVLPPATVPIAATARPAATFGWLPASPILTFKLHVPESWNTQAAVAEVDLDNMRVGDLPHSSTAVEYLLKDVLVAGTCADAGTGLIPNGLQLTLSPSGGGGGGVHSDTLVMQNLGYWQLKGAPGLWQLALASGRATELYDILAPLRDGSGPAAGPGGGRAGGGTAWRGRPGGSGSGGEAAAGRAAALHQEVVVRDFTGPVTTLAVRKKAGMESASLLEKLKPEGGGGGGSGGGGGGGELWGAVSRTLFGGGGAEASSEGKGGEKPLVHIFSLASGHLYERFLKIMMLAATKRSPSARLKFWLVENFLSPQFKAAVPALTAAYGFEVGYVTYKWPHWLRAQTEKQRIIWGYKILFLDVLFPLNVTKVIYVDSDQVVRADLRELWDLDLEGAPYAYTPFCDSRKETLGYQFWRSGYWKDHLRDRPYHISALYVVDLLAFRRGAVGDMLREVYDNLSRDPASLSNLDQDLPNFAQYMIPIHSLPQEWLWCESWCSDASKAAAKTIDLCNNPRFKEPKLDMAKRVISGPLFPESWVQLDAEVAATEAAAGATGATAPAGAMEVTADGEVAPASASGGASYMTAAAG